jgi:hypothetical protein
MSRPKLEVADIFRRFGAAWRAANEAHISLTQRRVMTAIEICRTAALGGHVERCEDCAHTRIAYNSCRNRHCPKCPSTKSKGAPATTTHRSGQEYGASYNQVHSSDRTQRPFDLARTTERRGKRRRIPIGHCSRPAVSCNRVSATPPRRSALASTSVDGTAETAEFRDAKPELFLVRDADNVHVTPGEFCTPTRSSAPHSEDVLLCQCHRITGPANCDDTKGCSDPHVTHTHCLHHLPVWSNCGSTSP